MKNPTNYFYLTF